MSRYSRQERFAGIGSEGYVALKMGRHFIGSELKRSYWDLAQKNLAAGLRDETWDRCTFKNAPKAKPVAAEPTIAPEPELPGQMSIFDLAGQGMLQ